MYGPETVVKKRPPGRRSFLKQDLKDYLRFATLRFAAFFTVFLAAFFATRFFGAAFFAAFFTVFFAAFFFAAIGIAIDYD